MRVDKYSREYRQSVHPVKQRLHITDISDPEHRRQRMIIGSVRFSFIVFCVWSFLVVHFFLKT